jgi:hypothetical protein
VCVCVSVCGKGAIFDFLAVVVSPNIHLFVQCVCADASSEPSRNLRRSSVVWVNESLGPRSREGVASPAGPRNGEEGPEEGIGSGETWTF